jgi:hypothetical protein
MNPFRSSIPYGLLLSFGLASLPALATDIIVSAQDGKFVRVDGRATFPEPAPSDSLVVIDASTFPPIIKGTLEGLEHTVQGPPHAVAVTPDGKLAFVAAPTRYDHAAKKELYDNFIQVVDIEASPPRLIVLLQMDVERAIGVFAVRNGKLVDTGARLKLAAGPVSIRSMPR